MRTPRGEVDVVPERGDEPGIFVDLDRRVTAHGILGPVDPEAIDAFEVRAAVHIGFGDDVPPHALRALDDRPQQPGNTGRAMNWWVRNILVGRVEREARSRTRDIAVLDRIEEPTHD